VHALTNRGRNRHDVTIVSLFFAFVAVVIMSVNLCTYCRDRF
jgi:hypothetical protein